MKTIDHLTPGMLVTNAELHDYFKVGNSGGMRKSNNHNCLVLICDHSKGLYDDRWEGDTLHYTGMGTKGDQSYDFAQNKTLYHSRTTGVKLYLFERFDGRKPYTFQGLCKLDSDPYLSRQLDTEHKMRDVCIFPLKLVGNSPVEFSIDERKVSSERKRRDAKKLTDEQLAQLEGKQDQNSPPASDKENKRTTNSSSYNRDPLVVEYALRRADGKCQLCNQIAPFLRRDKSPYLEVHHVTWLSKGGSDSWNNVVALCPNCHRKMHIVDDRKDYQQLVAIALQRLSRSLIF